MNKIKKVSLTLVCIVLLIGLTISTYALNYTNGVYTEDYVVGGDALTRAGYANKITNESYMGINLHYVKPRAGFIDPYSKLRFQIQTWSPGPDPTDFDF